MLTGKVGRAVPQTGGAGTKIDELNRFDKLNEETSPHFVSLAARAVSQSRRDCVLQPRVGTLFQRHSATGLSPVVPKYRAPRLSPMPERAALPWVSPSQNPATLKGLRRLATFFGGLDVGCWSLELFQRSLEFGV